MQRKKLLTNYGNKIEGPFLFFPKIHIDDRGYFYESWNQQVFESLIEEKVNFVQDNLSRSFKGVLRGLHYQLDPFGQGKLIRVAKGAIFDVIVDLRKSSSTYGEWIGVTLNDKENNQLWVPSGFAHGFLSITDIADVQYKTTNFWKKDSERTLIWNDINLNINWPLKKFKINSPIISKKDNLGSSFVYADTKGDIFL